MCPCDPVAQARGMQFGVEYQTNDKVDTGTYRGPIGQIWWGA